jgi:hypothetical protein
VFVRQAETWTSDFECRHPHRLGHGANKGGLASTELTVDGDDVATEKRGG